MCSLFIQLVQEAEDWGERLGELEEEMKMCERSHTGMLEDGANKDDRIKVKKQSHQTHIENRKHTFFIYIYQQIFLCVCVCACAFIYTVTMKMSLLSLLVINPSLLNKSNNFSKNNNLLTLNV